MATKKLAKTTPPSPDMDPRPVRHAPAAAAPKPKETTKRAKGTSPPLVDVGARASGGDSLVSDAPPDEVAAAAAPPPRKKSKTEKDGRAQDDEVEEKDEDAGAIEVSSEALSERDASTPEQKKAAVERSWSQDDELKILNALVEHAQSNGGAMAEPSHLLASLTFDKADANADKLNDKIRKLKTRYGKLRLKGKPTDNLGRRLFELSGILWGGQGQRDVDVQAEAASTMELSQRSSLYPYLAEEVKVYAKTHAYGDFIMAAFATIDDDTARHLDAMCRKQRVDAFNLELSQANLTKAMLSAFSSHIN
ncbi:unnamed protein product [Urochloa humidicola]